MKRTMWVLLLAALLIVLPAQAEDDEGYAALAYPAFDTLTNEIEILGTFLYTDQQSPDIEMKALFRPVMIDVNMKDGQWKTMNANMASRYTPEVTIQNPGTDCSFKVTMDFAKSKEKPGNREMSAIIASILTSFAEDPIAEKGIRFELLNLPNVTITSKTLYKPTDAVIEKLMAQANPNAVVETPAPTTTPAPAATRNRTTR